METNNQNQQIAEPPIQPLPTKKWYKHKGLIAIAVLAVIAGVLIWLYYRQIDTKDIDPGFTPPGSAEATLKQIAKQQSTISFDQSVYSKDWASHTIFNKFGIYVPAEWYEKQSTSTEVTFGAGIASYITVRYDLTDAIKTARQKTYLSSGRKVTINNILINGTVYQKYTLTGTCIEDDVCDSGYSDWYVTVGEYTIVVSEGNSLNVQSATLAAIVASIKPLADFTKIPVPVKSIGDPNIFNSYSIEGYNINLQYPSNLEISNQSTFNSFPTQAQNLKLLSASSIAKPTEHLGFTLGIYDNAKQQKPDDYLSSNSIITWPSPHTQKLINNTVAYVFKNEFNNTQTAIFFTNKYTVSITQDVNMDTAAFNKVINSVNFSQ